MALYKSSREGRKVRSIWCSDAEFVLVNKYLLGLRNALTPPIPKKRRFNGINSLVAMCRDLAGSDLLRVIYDVTKDTLKGIKINAYNSNMNTPKGYILIGDFHQGTLREAIKNTVIAKLEENCIGMDRYVSSNQRYRSKPTE